jgi:hypothetical protein
MKTNSFKLYVERDLVLGALEEDMVISKLIVKTNPKLAYII